MKKSLSCAALFLFLAGLAAMAAPAPGETVITSDMLEMDYREFVVLFDGNVDVRDPRFEMQSDRMFVFFANTNDVRRIKAIGNVRFSSENRSGSCNTAVYIKESGQIVMEGDAVLRREKDVVKGDKITIWIDDERVVSVPGTLVLQPETMQGPRENVEE